MVHLLICKVFIVDHIYLLLNLVSTCRHEEVEIVWKNCQHINNVHRPFDKVTFLRRARKPREIFLNSEYLCINKPEQVLYRKPRYADCFYQSKFGVLRLQLRHGGHDHAHRGDDDEDDGDVGDHLGRLRRLRLLYEVPQADLVLDKLARSKVLRRLCFEDARLERKYLILGSSKSILLTSFFISSITNSFLMLYLFWQHDSR